MWTQIHKLTHYWQQTLCALVDFENWHFLDTMIKDCYCQLIVFFLWCLLCRLSSPRHSKAFWNRELHFTYVWTVFQNVFHVSKSKTRFFIWNPYLILQAIRICSRKVIRCLVTRTASPFLRMQSFPLFLVSNKFHSSSTFSSSQYSGISVLHLRQLGTLYKG